MPTYAVKIDIQADPLASHISEATGHSISGRFTNVSVHSQGVWYRFPLVDFYSEWDNGDSIDLIRNQMHFLISNTRNAVVPFLTAKSPDKLGHKQTHMRIHTRARAHIHAHIHELSPNRVFT